MSNEQAIVTFWHWMVLGDQGGKPGFRRICDGWLAMHIAVGLVLALLTVGSGKPPFSTVLLPSLAVLVGITFAWAGNAQAIIRTREFRAIARHRDNGGAADYVYGFQLCIFVLLAAIGAWTIAAILSHPSGETTLSINAILYALLSLATRCSWQAVVGANLVLLSSIVGLDESERGSCPRQEPGRQQKKEQ